MITLEVNNDHYRMPSCTRHEEFTCPAVELKQCVHTADCVYLDCNADILKRRNPPGIMRCIIKDQKQKRKESSVQVICTRDAECGRVVDRSRFWES